MRVVRCRAVAVNDLKPGDQIFTNHPEDPVCEVRSVFRASCNGRPAVLVYAISGSQPWEFYFPDGAKIDVLE